MFSSPPSESNLLMVAHSISHLRTELGCSLPVEVFVGSWAQQLYPGWNVPEGPEWELQREVFALPGVQLRVVETNLHEYLDADNRFMWKVMVGVLACPQDVNTPWCPKGLSQWPLPLATSQPGNDAELVRRGSLPGRGQPAPEGSLHAL